MSKQKQDKQGGGWQFPRPLEIIKCKEGNKEYMKERPARKPYGRIVKVCEFSLEAVAEFGDDDARTVWGNGYATEAARSCLHYASLSKMESIISFTALSNLRSQRVMQRLGMTRLQEFDHPALPTGHPLQRHVLYMIRTSGYAKTEPETRPENLR